MLPIFYKCLCGYKVSGDNFSEIDANLYHECSIEREQMITYIGLDGEMSSADINSGGKLIQIGLAKFDNGELVSTSELLNPGMMDWQEEAYGVHKIEKWEVETLGKAPAEVDPGLADWVSTTKSRRDVVAVGFNVGSFDFPFLSQTLPILKSRLSRRSVDLNSIIFALSDNDHEVQRIKADSKAYAHQKMEGLFDGRRNREHDAEFDAVMSLYCFEYLRSLLNKTTNNL